MEHIREYLTQDALAAHLGMELVELSPGRALVRMPVRPEHLNAVNVVHGGASFALADFAFAAASNSHGTVAVALTASISYTRAGTGPELTAEATEISLGRKTATYLVTVRDAEGKTVALFQGTVYRKSDVIPGGEQAG